MPFTPELVDEINALLHFNLNSSLEGIKVHSSASPAIIAATKRLHEKALVTQSDGGYLTSLGRDAVEHAQVLLQVLTSSSEILHT